MIKETNKKYSDINVKRSLPQSSILNMFPIIQDNDGNYVYNIFRPYVLNEQIFKEENLDTTTLAYNEWWENISYDYYGTPYLWWTIPLTNNIINPFEDIDQGKNIYLLKQNLLGMLYSDVNKIRIL